MSIYSRKEKERVISLTREELVKEIGLPEDVSKSLSQLKDRGNLEDLLGPYPSSLEMPLEHLELLALWMNSRFVDPGPEKASRANGSNIGHGVTADYVETKNGTYISLKLKSGKELVSAFFDKEGLVTWTVRICGLPPSRLLQVLPEEKRKILSYIHSKPALAIAKLGINKSKLNVDKQVANSIYILLQVLIFLQDKTGQIDYKKKDQDCNDYNGCTGVPDFNFEECCNEHDRCYCRGCTEGDRLACDVSMYHCIKKKAWDWLAWLYYQGVRNLGGSHFNYCTGGEETLVPEEEEPTSPGRCFVSVTLLSVSHESGDVGNDWSYSVGVDGVSTSFAKHTLNPGETKSWNQPLYSQERGNCGNTISLRLFASAREHDVGPDDRGHNSQTVHIACPGLYRRKLHVSISEMFEETSTLEFLYEIRAFCTQ